LAGGDFVAADFSVGLAFLAVLAVADALAGGSAFFVSAGFSAAPETLVKLVRTVNAAIAAKARHWQRRKAFGL